MSLSRDFIEFVKCLNRRGVEYLLVGGHAVAFHGRPRFTKDIDFWIRLSPANAKKMIEALADFGFGDAGIRKEDLSTPGKVVQLGLPPNRIDLVTSAEGVDFGEAWKRRIETQYAGQKLFVIHLQDLVRNKKAMGRKQDLVDLDYLVTGNR